jgi:hypothetical protein
MMLLEGNVLQVRADRVKPQLIVVLGLCTVSMPMLPFSQFLHRTHHLSTDRVSLKVRARAGDSTE